MSSAASATAMQITMVTNSVKPSTPTMPPMVLYGPGTSGWMSHHSSELQPWTWAQSGRTLSAAATAMATVVPAKTPRGAFFRRNDEKVSISRPPTSRISSGSSAGQ